MDKFVWATLVCGEFNYLFFGIGFVGKICFKIKLVFGLLVILEVHIARHS
jgi:hypothetical protein